MATKDIFCEAKTTIQHYQCNKSQITPAVTLVKFRQNLADEKGPLPIA